MSQPSLKSTATPASPLSSTLEWPKHLRTPSELIQALRYKTKLKIIKSPLSSKLVLQFIGSWAYFLAHVLNRTEVYNKEVFDQELRRLEQQSVADEEDGAKSKRSETTGDRSPLITLSNHISCIDDPVMWAILLPFNYYFTQTENVRWAGAAVDICFMKPWHSAFFSLGKTFPLIRGAGLEQPAMEFGLALLKHNQWLHLFPEGRVMRDDKQQAITNADRGYNFKWGISKLILDYFRSSLSTADLLERNSEIRILPFYHLGMDKVLPVGRPYVPRFGHDITVYIRPSVIQMNSKLLTHILRTQPLSQRVQKSRSDDEISRIKLTNYLEQEMEKLVEPAHQIHHQRQQKQQAKEHQVE